MLRDGSRAEDRHPESGFSVGCMVQACSEDLGSPGRPCLVGLGCDCSCSPSTHVRVPLSLSAVPDQVTCTAS